MEARGFRAKVDEGKPDAEKEALAEVVRLRRPFRVLEERNHLRRAGTAVGSRRVWGSKDEREHARAISDRIALFADADPDIQEFRRWLLGSPKTLTPTDARALLTSPLLRYATMMDLERWGVPVVGHAAVIAESPAEAESAHTKIRVTWSKGDRTLTFWWRLPGPDPIFMEYPNERGCRVPVSVSLASVLDDLRRKADELAFGAPYNALRLSEVGAEPACLWLILTGKALPLEPITAGREVPGSVDSMTITALTRVALPASIMAAVASMQRRTLGHRKGRPLESRNLALVLFVERRTPGQVQRLSPEAAKKLLNDWNRKHAKHRGWPFSDWGDLRRAYERAKVAFFPDPNEYAIAALAVVEAVIRARTNS